MLRDVKGHRQSTKKLFEIKFNSPKKWQFSLHQPEDPEIDYPVLVLKGAHERVLKMCKKIMYNSEDVDLDASWEMRCT